MRAAPSAQFRDRPASLTASQTQTLRAMLEAELNIKADQLTLRRAALIAELPADPSGLTRATRMLHLFTALHEIDEIRAALARIDEGRYGACLTCSQPLSFEHLRVLPQARTCDPCPIPATNGVRWDGARLAPGRGEDIGPPPLVFSSRLSIRGIRKPEQSRGRPVPR